MKKELFELGTKIKWIIGYDDIGEYHDVPVYESGTIIKIVPAYQDPDKVYYIAKAGKRFLALEDGEFQLDFE